MCTSDTNMKYDEINRNTLQETSRNHPLEFLYGIGILVQVPILQQILQLLLWRKLDDVSLLLCLLDTRKASNANQSPHAFHLALAS